MREHLIYEYKHKLYYKIELKYIKKFNSRLPRVMTNRGIRFINRDSFNESVYNWIVSGKSFMVARLGETECATIYQGFLAENGYLPDISEKRKEMICNNAGFFPKESKKIQEYVDLMKNVINNADILGFWETEGQEEIIDAFGSYSLRLTNIDNLHPYDYIPKRRGKVWTSALKGKKVLVIHPFADTICEQYKKRKAIWNNEDILPEFELKTIKAVQTIAGQTDERFKDWFEALDYMYKEALKIDFDIAIIACGAYGICLASMLKDAGKQAFHWGGIMQLWFGIKGKRWDNNPKWQQYFNESWVRPSLSETPTNNVKIEDGCYW